MNLTAYVAGLMFDPSLHRVALIRKNKPDWQRGKLNGIGGKVEKGEAAVDAMVREFMEETGCGTIPEPWIYFACLAGSADGVRWNVRFFACTGDLSLLRSPEEEKVEIIAVADVHSLRGEMVENLPWLIPLALDCIEDGRPELVTAFYP